MVDESVYVAIAIACVVALLVLVILIIYCIKRQQDKMNERLVRERRRREERQRRNFQRAQIVQPPSYEVSRGRQQPVQSIREIPWSPPPEYKELVTPVPGQRQNQTVGIGGVYDTANGYPPEYEISSVSRNVAPVYTYLPPGVSIPTSNSAHIIHNSNNNNNPNNITYSNNNRNVQHNRDTVPAHQSDNAIQVQVTPRSVLPDVVTSATGGSGSGRPISSNHRAIDEASLPRPTNVRSNVNTNRRGAEQQSSGPTQSQTSAVGNSHRARTPARSSSRTAGGHHSETSRGLAETSGSNTTSSAPKNQIPAQFQDLSLI